MGLYALGGAAEPRKPDRNWDVGVFERALSAGSARPGGCSLSGDGTPGLRRAFFFASASFCAISMVRRRFGVRETFIVWPDIINASKSCRDKIRSQRMSNM